MRRDRRPNGRIMFSMWRALSSKNVGKDEVMGLEQTNENAFTLDYAEWMSMFHSQLRGFPLLRFHLRLLWLFFFIRIWFSGKGNVHSVRQHQRHATRTRAQIYRIICYRIFCSIYSMLLLFLFLLSLCVRACVRACVLMLWMKTWNGIGSALNATLGVWTLFPFSSWLVVGPLWCDDARRTSNVHDRVHSTCGRWGKKNREFARVENTTRRDDVTMNLEA